MAKHILSTCPSCHKFPKFCQCAPGDVATCPLCPPTAAQSPCKHGAATTKFVAPKWPLAMELTVADGPENVRFMREMTFVIARYSTADGHAFNVIRDADGSFRVQP